MYISAHLGQLATLIGYVGKQLLMWFRIVTFLFRKTTNTKYILKWISGVVNKIKYNIITVKS